MSRLLKTLASVAFSATALSAVPAKALQVTAPIQNAPQTLSTSGNVNLQFAAFNSTNFAPQFSGLLPNQSLVLNFVTLKVKGAVSGSFDVTNSSITNTISVGTNVVQYILNANGLNSANNATTNVGGTVTTAGQSQQYLPAPGGATNPDPSSCVAGNPPTINIGGVVYVWNCVAPTTSSFAINQPGTTSEVAWTISPGTGVINPITSSFWTTGASINVPATMQFQISQTGLSGTPTGSYLLSSLPADTFLTYDYSLVTNTGVPAPLPVLGAGIGFGFSRRLRRRIKSTSTLAA